ncbi:MAG: hypothetical protein KA954_11570 [Chitinophagales bacterium]|nr:hypothetical protein [Chitinophagales bacterium]MBP8754400.1 hypothetical protein [Chitinophagales bacterium]MBP9190555.1 hypothetical protein [Chitinophagales bacterium]MBP9549797.1 hypothetical protein [Chitinophagales bacterium]MBP9704031.1 hypothetical protein [Chitinophagales bacterium]
MNEIIEWIFSFQFRSDSLRRRAYYNINKSMNQNVSQSIKIDLSEDFAKDSHLNAFHESRYKKALSHTETILNKMQFEFLTSNEDFISNEIGGFSIVDEEYFDGFRFHPEAIIYYILSSDLAVKISKTTNEVSKPKIRNAELNEISKINLGVIKAHKLFVISKKFSLLNELNS